MKALISSSPHRSGIALVCVLALMMLCRDAVGQAGIPPLSGRVVDAAGVLSDDTERTLNTYLTILEDSTTNQVVVLTIASLEGETIESFSLRAGREWGIGTKENDNGVLLVVAPNDREVRIEVGYGLEGALPDVVASRIIRNDIIPRFRDGDYDGGVTDGVYAIGRAIDSEYELSGSDGLESEAAIRAFLILVFFSLASIGAFSALMMKRVARWIVFASLIPFYATVGFFLTMSAVGAFLVIVLYFGVFLFLSRSAGVERLRKKVAKAAKAGETVVIMGGWSTGSGGSRSWKSVSGSGGFGGFSGGGGSFGGGGASGSW